MIQRLYKNKFFYRGMFSLTEVRALLVNRMSQITFARYPTISTKSVFTATGRPSSESMFHSTSQQSSI